ncbi:unnamed protein product [Symbiodinium natans]|uniref:Uncharacterized protein n=1 Tax=Symbiodinium natans TaxID=878477 RepID=A0A812SQN3_9DINO|nr:unnamed protein product [Symbiodinium natans]
MLAIMQLLAGQRWLQHSQAVACLWPILPFAALTAAEASVLYTQLPFIKTTFFAERRLAQAHAAAGEAKSTSRWNINCARTPKQLLCKVGTADAAYWDALLEGLAGVLAVPSALSLGILSDSHGRKPFLQLKALLNVASALLLLSATHAGSSLWPFLWVNSMDHSIDAAGVVLAVLADLTQDHKAERSTALGMLGTFVAGVACLCLVVASTLPSSTAAQVVLLISTLKLGLLLFHMPETGRRGAEEMEGVSIQIPDMLQEGVGILRRHAVMQRLAIVLCLASAGVTGRHIFLQFYLASNLGADKADFALLLPASIPGMVISFVFVLPLLAKASGELAALKAVDDMLRGEDSAAAFQCSEFHDGRYLFQSRACSRCARSPPIPSGRCCSPMQSWADRR